MVDSVECAVSAEVLALTGGVDEDFVSNNARKPVINADVRLKRSGSGGGEQGEMESEDRES